LTRCMTIDEISDFVQSLGDVLTVSPQEGDGTPEMAWGDRFFYYAPDGAVPPGQPFATIVTKEYPGEPPAGLGDGATSTPAAGTRPPSRTRPCATR